MKREPLFLALACAVLALVACASLLAGRVWLAPQDVLAALLHPEPDLAGLIVSEVRLPRMVLAIAVGAALGLSGAVLQGLTRNPLAEPGLLGVSAGAALGAVIAIYYGLSAVSPLATPVFGLLGALGAAALTFGLSRGGGVLSLVLAGAAVSSLAGAGLALALNLAPSPYAAFEIATWLLGSLADRSWDHVLLAGPFIALGCALLLLTGRAIDALSLGEAQAESLGVHVERARILALIGTALAVGAATAVAGAVGFVGLIAPHLARPLAQHRPGGTLLLSAAFGAILILLADIAARVFWINVEIKLGVLTALIGAPFFLWLVAHLKARAP
jgi:iron complex transport system permease protein